MGLEPIALSFCQCLIVLSWTFHYGIARQGRAYSEDRERVESNPRFKFLAPLCFFLGNAITIYSFWSDSPWILKFHRIGPIEWLGICLSFFASLLHIVSMRHLGANYSPCFDAHRPHEIIKTGPYKYIRHPVYTANLIIGIGTILTSGSLVVLGMYLYCIFEICRSLVREEKFLAKNFPGYQDYQKTTHRLIPYIY